MMMMIRGFPYYEIIDETKRKKTRTAAICIKLNQNQAIQGKKKNHTCISRIKEMEIK